MYIKAGKERRHADARYIDALLQRFRKSCFETCLSVYETSLAAAPRVKYFEICYISNVKMLLILILSTEAIYGIYNLITSIALFEY